MRRTKLIFAFTVFSLITLFNACKLNINKTETPVTPEPEPEPEPKNFLLSYYPGIAIGDPLEEEVLSGTKFNVKENFYEVPLDRKFAGWTSRSNGRGTGYTPGESVEMPYYDLYLFAHFIDADSYGILYKNCEGQNIENNNPVEFKKDEDIILEAAVKPGYIFGGWFTEEDFSDSGITGWQAGEQLATITLYAKWIPEHRTVTYKAGSGTGEDIIFEVDYDSSFTFEEFSFEVPKNKKFTTWSIGEETFKPGDSFGPVHEDIEISAGYKYFERGDISKMNIEINGVLFNNTAETCVVSPESPYLIEGSDSVWNSYVWGEDHGDFKGAFIDGRKVQLSPFAVSKYLVTRELFRTVFGKLHENSTTITYPNEVDNYVAAGGISWYTSIAFCNKLTLLSGGTLDDLVYSIEGVEWETLTLSEIPASKNIIWEGVTCDISKPGYRLLTEAEWEFAARGGDTSEKEFYYPYPGFDTELKITYGKEEGDLLDLDIQSLYNFKIASKTTSLNNWVLINDETTKEYAWLSNNSEGMVHQVGLLKPNTLGLYDMGGNLWEWVWDYYSDSPCDADNPDEEGIVINPMGPETGSYKIRKGCNFQADYGFAVKAASSYRGDRMAANTNNNNCGLRIGRSLVE